MRILLCMVLLDFFLAIALARNAAKEESVKAETAVPISNGSPPEGNTTFLDGTTWCVARPGASQYDIQTALDWACGVGMADCTAIQQGGACYHPDTLLSHASYAFNNYYQQNGNNDIACYFGGTAALTKHDPSYGKCLYAASGSIHSSARALLEYRPFWCMWEYVGVLLLLFYMGS